MKETDWFSLTVLPIRVGVYKTRHRGTDGRIFEGYCWWNGKKWGYTTPTVHVAAADAGIYPSSQQSREWKGIYKETS